MKDRFVCTTIRLTPWKRYVHCCAMVNISMTCLPIFRPVDGPAVSFVLLHHADE